MAKGMKTGGRQKGSLNKTTGLAKDAIAAAAEGLGGTERIVAWAKESPENEKAFWTQLYTKLIPVQLDAAVTGEIGVVFKTVYENK